MGVILNGISVTCSDDSEVIITTPTVTNTIRIHVPIILIIPNKANYKRKHGNQYLRWNSYHK